MPGAPHRTSVGVIFIKLWGGGIRLARKTKHQVVYNLGSDAIRAAKFVYDFVCKFNKACFYLC